MTLDWLFRALAAGVLLGIAALAAERVAGWFGLARRWTWAAAITGSLLLPVLALATPGALPDIPFPRWGRAPAGSPASSTLPAPPRTAARAGAEAVAVEGRPLPRALGLAWLAASLALLGCVAWSYRRLHTVADGCVASRVEGVRVLVSERAGPMVLGVVHPELVLPRWVLQAPPEERRLIVRHEREHVAAGDPRLLLLATLAVALMPWSPALWVQHRRLRLALETDCDARVLAAGASRRLYGQALLRTATHPFPLPVLAPAWGERTSHLRQRIDAMTAKPPTRRLLRALPLCGLAVALFAVACDVASKGISSADTRPAVDVVDGEEVASQDFPDGTGIMVVRNREPDPTLGYTGLTPYYAERPVVVRDGVRARRRVESFPVVVGVDPGSPAERAGFRERDVLLSVNGRDSREPPTERLRPGTELTYRVRRDGREIQLRLVAASSPPEVWPPSQAEFEAAHRQGEVMETLKP